MFRGLYQLSFSANNAIRADSQLCAMPCLVHSRFAQIQEGFREIFGKFLRVKNLHGTRLSCPTKIVRGIKNSSIYIYYSITV